MEGTVQWMETSVRGNNVEQQCIRESLQSGNNSSSDIQ